MQDQPPPPVEVVTAEPVAASIVWLHGLGADGHDFEPLVPALQLPARPGVRFVFPHAPRRPVTLNGGMVMRAWYDLYGPDFSRGEDEAGLEDARRRVTALIQREHARGVPARHIALAGFSQGGAVALHTGLAHPEPLGGILALSTYLPLASQFARRRHPANARTPVLMLHGDQDPIVPPALAQASQDVLRAAGQPVEWQLLPMAHEVSPQAVALIHRWLADWLRAIQRTEDGQQKTEG